MGSYVLNFSVYTMAMCGLIFFALFIYKKFACDGIYSKKSRFLNVEDTLQIAPRKILYVVRAGNEKFLIAGDADKTSLISKLDINEMPELENQISQVQIKSNKNLDFSEYMDKTLYPNTEKHTENKNFKSIDDLPQIVDFKQKSNPKSGNVIKSMISKVKE